MSRDIETQLDVLADISRSLARIAEAVEGFEKPLPKSNPGILKALELIREGFSAEVCGISTCDRPGCYAYRLADAAIRLAKGESHV